MAVWTLALKDLRLLVRDARAAVILLAMPLIFILVLGLTLGEGFGQKPDDALRITVVDEDAGLPPDPGPFPGRKWSEVVRDDLADTAGVRVEVVADRATAAELVGKGRRAAVLVFGKEFSARVHQCSFLDDRFLTNPPGINPFFRDGISLSTLDVEVLEDAKQPLSASVIKQVAQVSLLRVVMPWMIGKAFDKISDKQFIDELAERVAITPSLTAPVRKPLKQLSDKQRLEVGTGVQEALQEMFRKYDLRAKTWAALTRSEPGAAEGGGVSAYEDVYGSGLVRRGAIRYRILVPSYTVMFAFFLVLTMGWMFVAERRQGTLLRLRAAPLSRGEILLGKLLPCYAVSVGQGLFLLAAGGLLFGIGWGPKPWLAVPGG